MITRRVPGTVWLRIEWCNDADPGHEWLYRALVRRDTFTVRRHGIVLMWMHEDEVLRRRRIVQREQRKRPPA